MDRYQLERVLNHIRLAGLGILICCGTAAAADQTKPGEGNAAAVTLAKASHMVQSAYESLNAHALQIKNWDLRTITLDALINSDTCIAHRAGVTDDVKTTILQRLIAEGLVNVTDDQTFPGGLKAGVFPPVLEDGSDCPHLPQPFFSAPGSVFHGHHSYPGGLPVHESFNLQSSLSLANFYRAVYGKSDQSALPVVDPRLLRGLFPRVTNAEITIDDDIMIAAPLWHDWAKSIVFQWNADGTEFLELNFGGNGSTDNYGASADSRTGGHHIMSIAEMMARRLAPDVVITMASAHSTPTSGNEYKVVNWLRAAAIIAQIDPVAKGYLYLDKDQHLRLPPVRQLGSVDLPGLAPGQPNVLAEYVLHNISDSDFTLTGPAISDVEPLLGLLAPDFGFDPSDPAYNIGFRNVVFSYLTAERLLILYGNGGLSAIASEVQKLRALGIL
jgi:hypothetical protein